MEFEPVDDIGDLLRDLRGVHDWSQQELADHAGRGASLRSIQAVEAGAKPTWKFIQAVANALGVDPIALLASATGASHRTGRTLRKLDAAMPHIRTVLASYDAPVDRPAGRSAPQFEADVHSAGLNRLDAKYGDLAESIAPLIEDLTIYAHLAPRGSVRERAFWLLAVAYRSLDGLLYKAGHADLSALAVERIGWAAAQSGDPLMSSTAFYVRAQGFFDFTRPDAVRAGLARIVAEAEPLAPAVVTNRHAAAVYGSLHARAAVLAAKAGMAGSVHAHLAAAGDAAAAAGGDGVDYYTYFGEQQVEITRIAALVELGETAAAVAAAESWSPAQGTPGERSSHGLIDQARAEVQERRPIRAVDCLVRARLVAPQHTRMHPLVAPTLEAAIAQQRRPTSSALTLATWLGVSAR